MSEKQTILKNVSSDNALIAWAARQFQYSRLIYFNILNFPLDVFFPLNLLNIGRSKLERG